MSDLLRVIIERVDDKKCVAVLESIHPHQTEIPFEHNIAFQIVMEAYKQFGPFDNHPWKEKMDMWASYMERQPVPITKGDFQKYDSGEVDLPEGYSGTGFEDENYYLMRKENNYEFVRAANNEISDAKLIDENESNEFPSGRLAFEAFENELLSHLKQGMTWTSAMYNRQLFM